jgi:hypothetical protein
MCTKAVVCTRVCLRALHLLLPLPPINTHTQHHHHLIHQEESFHLVDNRPVKPKPFGQRRFQPNRFQPRGGRGGDRAGDARGDRGGKKQDQQKRQQWQSYGRDQQRVRWWLFGGSKSGVPPPPLCCDRKLLNVWLSCYV